MSVFAKAKLERAYREVERVLEFGDQKHPGNNWRKQSLGDVVSHAHGHENEFMTGSSVDAESQCHNLAHGIVRRLMALEKILEEDEKKR